VNRRVLLCAALAALASASSGGPAGAEQHTTVITVVVSQDIEPFRQTLAGFQKALGRRRPAPLYRIVFLHGADESPRADATPELEHALGEAQDLVLAIGGRAARAVRSLAARAPVVVAAVTDSRLEARPPDGGPPVIGVSMDVPFAQQFQTLHAVAPQARRVGTIYGSANRALVATAVAAAKESGLTLLPVEIASVKELPEALSGLLGRVNLLWAFPDTTVFSPETAPYIILETLRHRIPFMGLSQNFVKAGSLLGLYCDFQDIGMQAATMAGEILDGKHPAGGGIVPPRKALLAINLRVADVIGFNFPADIRRRANSIYE
jgi:putative tryptophan/tyrosine transport system substrate-binding protein